MILIFNVETTGLLNKKNKPDGRVIQISWRLYDFNRNLLDISDYIIKPTDFEISEESINIHGITKEYALEHGVNSWEVFRLFSQYLERSKIIAAHNLEFDLLYLKYEFFRNTVRFKDEVFPEDYEFDVFEICTMKSGFNYMYKEHGSFKYPSLEELYYALFNERLANAHNAKFDVEYTSNVFWNLVDLNYILLPRFHIDDKIFNNNHDFNKWFNSLEKKLQQSVLGAVYNYSSKDFEEIRKFLNPPSGEYNFPSNIHKIIINRFYNERRLDYEFKDISVLKKYINIETLFLGWIMQIDYEDWDMGYTMFEHIPDFSSLKRLKNIELATSSNDISPLTKIKSIETVEIKAKNLTTVGQLCKLPFLRKLNLSKCKLKTLESIYGIKSLTELHIDSNELIDISTLNLMPNIRKVIIYSNSLSQDCLQKIDSKMRERVEFNSLRF